MAVTTGKLFRIYVRGRGPVEEEEEHVSPTFALIKRYSERARRQAACMRCSACCLAKRVFYLTVRAAGGGCAVPAVAEYDFSAVNRARCSGTSVPVAHQAKDEPQPLQHGAGADGTRALQLHTERERKCFDSWPLPRPPPLTPRTPQQRTLMSKIKSRSVYRDFIGQFERHHNLWDEHARHQLQLHCTFERAHCTDARNFD